MMEKLLRDTKQKDDDYQYLYWIKYGKYDWEDDKDKHIEKLSIGESIKIPNEYVTGPDYDGSDSFTDATRESGQELTTNRRRNEVHYISINSTVYVNMFCSWRLETFV